MHINDAECIYELGQKHKVFQSLPGPKATRQEKAFICVANTISVFIYNHEHNIILQMTGYVILWGTQ